MNASDDEQEQAERLEAKIRRRQTLRVVTLLVLAGAFAAVALDNTQDVVIGWVLDEATVPLILALLASFVVGAIIGALGVRRRP